MNFDDKTERSAVLMITLASVVVGGVGKFGNGPRASSVSAASLEASDLKSLENLTCVSNILREVELISADADCIVECCVWSQVVNIAACNCWVALSSRSFSCLRFKFRSSAALRVYAIAVDRKNRDVLAIGCLSLLAMRV